MLVYDKQWVGIVAWYRVSCLLTALWRTWLFGVFEVFWSH